MNDFEINLPTTTELSINVTNKELYNYDFSSYSLLPLQEAVGLSIIKSIKNELFSHISEAKLLKQLLEKGETEYVANFSDLAKKKLTSGEWSLGIRKKTGETYAIIKDTLTGRTKSTVTLDERTVRKLGNLPELSAIQGQLAAITEKIEDLNRLVERVEQGQYNDRFSGFHSARQLVIEGLVSHDSELKKELLISAIKTNNDTIAKLMFAIYQDAHDFTNIKIKSKDAKRIERLLQQSIGYLNSAVQLNLVAYSAVAEDQALLATLSNYHSFIEQTLLKKLDDSGHTLAWKIDNAHQGDSGCVNEIMTDISTKIDVLVHEIQGYEIGGKSNEKLTTETL
ncbi:MULTISPECIES: hypothetical protein [unclassified Enterococcus]|uniref:hypothetical protein n=1 Tax=unclassified Enterococcus TaxID=2608891 RepID=UPI001A92EEF9|nr:hypothetical protein [Enterococcus sp. DIV1298c]MBO1300730.1 hypothetical protein [Enterococcus sp. DIV1271a]